MNNTRKVFEIRNGILDCYNEGYNEVVIPDGVCVIDTSVFCGCFEMHSVHIPDSVVIIGDFAFRKCSGLRQITLPNNLQYIGREAFAQCVNLAEITIPESIREIGEKAFCNCKNLQTVNCLGNPVIGKKAFYKTPFGLNKRNEVMLWNDYLKEMN